MHPVNFEGATEIAKPAGMTDAECSSIFARYGIDKMMVVPMPPAGYAGKDDAGFIYFLTAWQPSYEDLQALNRGESVYVKTVSQRLPPMVLFTLDEDMQPNV